MKVLIFGNISGQGGIQSHLRWLTKALVESQQEVLIISPQPLTNQGFSSQEVSKIGVRVHQINCEEAQ